MDVCTENKKQISANQLGDGNIQSGICVKRNEWHDCSWNEGDEWEICDKGRVRKKLVIRY